MNPVEEPQAKRRRTGTDNIESSATFKTAAHIEEALSFRSSTSPEVRASVQRFKDFLSSIQGQEQDAQLSIKLQVLQGYCRLQTATSKEQADFPDLLATWSHAVETSNDAIASAVPAVLAQFFKTISGLLDFRDFGLSLCHSLLKRDQVRLFDRGLSSAKSKPHLISPCLRLLTEIMSFDGGTMANHLFGRRDVLFKRLEVLLDSRPLNSEEDRRKPTVRRMALRLVLASLKFLDAAARVEFLTQGRILRSCLVGLRHDGDDIVTEVLTSMDTAILNDVNIHKPVKVRIFNPDNLSALAALYEYELDPSHPYSASVVRSGVHNLLLEVCANRKGISISHNGWYPVGYEISIEPFPDPDHIDLGLDSPQYFDDYSDRVPVKNPILSNLLQTLKPDDDALQAELLLKTLSFTPELVAEYFTKRARFSVSASNDSSWRSQFALMFSIVQLPVPKNLGWHEDVLPHPPPISIVIENIIPKPFDRASLTKFFSLNDEILIISGSRLLSIALKKLGQVLECFAKFQDDSPIWTQAARRLVEATLRRVPRYKDILEAFQRYGKEKDVICNALFECLAMFHQMLPEATIGSKFDIGPLMSNVLHRTSSKPGSDEDKVNLTEQLSWLVIIAHLSPVTKWWSKSGTDGLSLFMILVKFVTSQNRDDVVSKMFQVLELVASSSGIFGNSKPSVSSFWQSLRARNDFAPVHELYEFIDNAISRAIQRPVRYLDRIEGKQRLVSDRKPLGLLACSVAEQWEFAFKRYNGQKSVIKNISRWTAWYYSALDSVGENFRVLSQFQEDMLEATTEPKYQKYLRSSFKQVMENSINTNALMTNVEAAAELESASLTNFTKSPTERHITFEGLFPKAIAAPTSLEGLDRWDSKSDIENAVHSGRIAKLIICTASAQSEIRFLAFQLLQNLTHVVEASPYSEKASLYLLLGEIGETLRQNDITVAPLPSIVAELGVKLLYILTDPAHKMFGKANKFLLRSPSWDVDKLIPHWTDKILFHEPEADEAGARTEELEWFLGLLVDGLKQPADMELYRRSGVFEKLLALYSSPSAGRSVRKKILNVLWRVINLDKEHGDRQSMAANTLITRVGVHEWLDFAAATDPHHASIIHQIARELDSASDKEVIAAWKKACPLTKTKDLKVR